MKYKLLYLFAVLAVLIVGCVKSSTSITSPPTPSGTFTGQFRYLHRHTNKVPFDTLKATITVKLLTTDNTYAVTGDTATVHAGSYGSFVLTSPYMVFTDKTYSPTAPQTKSHLTGPYLYYYDGTTFQLLSYSVDTIAYQYDLKKTAN
ncbi:MAG: hypothetical protein ACXVB0_22090 [Mucilaginibacter sp.]